MGSSQPSVAGVGGQDWIRLGAPKTTKGFGYEYYLMYGER